LQQNMMRRHQMGLVFEAIKLLLLLVSGYLTYQFLGRFLPNMWFRIAALAMYELGLLAWHYIHHWKVETPRQHMFSKNMERLCLLAVGSAAGFQLLSMVSAGFGDHLPGWTHTVVEFVTVAIFMIQIWAFTRWEKLSRYYQAVEHSYNRELAGNQTGMIQATLAQTDTVRVVEADENSAALPAASEADADTSSNGDSVAQNTLQKVVKMLPQSTKRVRLEDRVLALESLAKAHPELSVKDLSSQTGLGESTIRKWQKEGR
jgi:hypothetical protein